MYQVIHYISKLVARQMIYELNFHRSEIERSQLLRTKLSSAVSTALDNADVANKDLLSSIQRKFVVH